MPRLALCAALLAAGVALSPAHAAGPIAATIQPNFGVAIELFATVPASAGSEPLARINQLFHAGDGSGRVFVNDMRGELWAITADGTVLTPAFLDLTTAPGVSLVSSGLQRGFSSFAFHPDYADPARPGYRRLYTVTHETTASGTPDFGAPTTPTFHNVLTEWQVSASDPDQVDTSTRREILRVEGYSPDHPMGGIGFEPGLATSHPDYGLLFVALGDGGDYIASAGDTIDPYGNGQTLTRAYAKLLRIDPLGTSDPQRPTNGAYGIPADNPFVSTSGAVQETWAYGLRNPHRFGWDPNGSRAMWIADIGQKHIEEVNRGVAGANYGWSERQGSWVLDRDDETVFPPLPPNDDGFGYSYPVGQYDHDDGVAISAGAVYRGSDIPALVGQLVFGDIVNGRLFHMTADALATGDEATIYELQLSDAGQLSTLLDLLGNPPRADLRFGRDEAGEIYVLSKRDGSVRVLPEPGGVLGLLLAALALWALSGCTASSQRVAIDCVPESVEIYVDGELLEGERDALFLRSDEPHKVFFKRPGHRPELIVIESLVDEQGRPRLDRDEVCIELVPVGQHRVLEVEAEFGEDD